MKPTSVAASHGAKPALPETFLSLLPNSHEDQTEPAKGLGQDMFDGSSVLQLPSMSGRNGQELLSMWVPAELAEAFKAQARTTDGGA